MSNCGCGSQGAAQRAVDPVYRRILWLVLGLNAVMFGIEGVWGWIAQSSALQGDSLDFLGDAANYGIALFVLARSVAWRAGAALAKGLTMGAFGLFVLGFTIWRAANGAQPEAVIMGWVGLLALSVNLSVTALLFRWREGDANMRSVWICSRNDALANLAVIGAALAVGVTATGWADWAVGLLIAGLSLQGAWVIVRQSLGELRPASA